MTDYRDDSYHRLRHPELLGDDELLVAWSHFADLAYFQHVRAGRSVLEFGGGLGNNLVAVSKRARVCMVEPAPLGREMARKHGIESAESLRPLEGRRFDTVLCRHVLEHLDHPLATLRELVSHLAPDGRLVVAVPVEPSRRPPARNDLDHHLYCWNPQTLLNLLQRAGLSVLEWHHEFYGAKRKLLPVYRAFGGPTYARCVRFVGRVFRFKELVAVAVPAPGHAARQ